MKKHKRKIVILLTFIAMLFATVTIFIAFHPPAVTFSESLRFPVGTRVTLSDVIVNVEFGKLTEPNKVLDSSKQGLVKVTFSLQNLLTIESEREIMLEFYLPESEENKTAEPEEITTAEPGETVPT
ncbi:MAG: hypothetical protein IJC26_03865, partial [Clostridia bacterium]|nr:hypothetical protein [Clostridia bacterium]